MNKRRAWHLKNKTKAWNYAQKRCEECDKLTTLYKGSIHHLKYLSNCYEDDVCVIDMMDQDICMWLCRKCHRLVHLATSYEESLNNHEKKSGYCTYCGRYAHACWDRAKTLQIRKCICRQCYEVHKRRGVDFDKNLAIQSGLNL